MTSEVYVLGRRGYGEKQAAAHGKSRRRIMAALSVAEWTRFNSIRETTRMSPSALSKHLKKLILEGLVENRVDLGEYPHPSSYRITPTPTTRVDEAAVAVQGLSRVKGSEILSENASLYTEAELSDNLTDETLRRLDVALNDAEAILGEVYGLLVVEQRRLHLSKILGPISKANEYAKLIGLVESFDDRWSRCGVVEGIEADEIRRVEERYLASLGKTSDDLEGSVDLWTRMNRIHRRHPITLEAYGRFCEIRSRLESAKPILDELEQLMLGGEPRICLVVHTDRVKVSGVRLV